MCVSANHQSVWKGRYFANLGSYTTTHDPINVKSRKECYLKANMYVPKWVYQQFTKVTESDIVCLKLQWNGSYADRVVLDQPKYTCSMNWEIHCSLNFNIFYKCTLKSDFYWILECWRTIWPKIMFHETILIYSTVGKWVFAHHSDLYF